MIADLVMNGLSGVDTVRLARRTRPDLKVLFCSGYADMSRFGGNIGSDTLLKKPFRPDTLAEAVQTALQRVSSDEPDNGPLRRDQLTGASTRSEGYTATAGDALIRRELCSVAIRLGRVLCAIDAKDPEGRGQPHLGAGIVRVDLERAEQLAEGELLLITHRRLGEDQDTVAIEGRFDLGKGFGCHCQGEVDPAHFGAECRVKRSYFCRHVCWPERCP